MAVPKPVAKPEVGWHTASLIPTMLIGAGVCPERHWSGVPARSGPPA
jgi:hypothetical protein